MSWRLLPHTLCCFSPQKTLVPMPLFPRQPCEHVRVIFTACLEPHGSVTVTHEDHLDWQKPPNLQPYTVAGAGINSDQPQCHEPWHTTHRHASMGPQGDSGQARVLTGSGDCLSFLLSAQNFVKLLDNRPEILKHYILAA